MEAVTKIKAVDSPFSDSLFFAAGALSREVEKLALECWKPTGLSPSLGQIIYFLIHYVEITGPMVVAQNLFLDPSTVTRLLEKLERKGLVLRFTYDRIRMVQATQKSLANGATDFRMLFIIRETVQGSAWRADQPDLPAADGNG